MGPAIGLVGLWGCRFSGVQHGRCGWPGWGAVGWLVFRAVLWVGGSADL